MTQSTIDAFDVAKIVKGLELSGFETTYIESKDSQVEDDSIQVKYCDIHIQIGQSGFSVARRKNDGTIWHSPPTNDVNEVIALVEQKHAEIPTYEVKETDLTHINRLHHDYYSCDKVDAHLEVADRALRQAMQEVANMTKEMTDIEDSLSFIHDHLRDVRNDVKGRRNDCSIRIGLFDSRIKK